MTAPVLLLDSMSLVYRAHHTEMGRDTIKAAQARLWFLPPYSPDLNPIEQTFSKIKHWMRLAQKRNIKETWLYLGTLINQVEPHECANFFENSGYASVKT